MADDEEDLKESVVDLTPEEEPKKAPEEAGEKAAASKPPPVPGPSSTPAAPAAGMADLQRQIQAERQDRARLTEENRRIAAERDQAMYYAQEAERRGVSTYELYNENQIKATQDAMESLALEGERAMQDGDFKRAQTINLKIGRLGGSLAVLERDQAVLVQQREAAEAQARQPRQQPQAPQQPRQQQQVPTDPLERAIHGRSEPAKNFIRKHPEIVRGDGTLKRNVIDAHERALDEGFQADTPGYFEYIERSLTANTPGTPPMHSSRGGAPTMAAPVTRGAAPGAGGNGAAGGSFTMTPKMRRLAAEQGVTEKEWAQNYVRLLAEGRITPVS